MHHVGRFFNSFDPFDPGRQVRSLTVPFDEPLVYLCGDADADFLLFVDDGVRSGHCQVPAVNVVA